MLTEDFAGELCIMVKVHWVLDEKLYSDADAMDTITVRCGIGPTSYPCMTISRTEKCATVSRALNHGFFNNWSHLLKYIAQELTYTSLMK